MFISLTEGMDLEIVAECDYCKLHITIHDDCIVNNLKTYHGDCFLEIQNAKSA